MRISCNSCEWVGEIASAAEHPEHCPGCGGTEFTIGNETAIPAAAQTSTGAQAIVHSANVFPSEYPAATQYPRCPFDMTGEECLEELRQLQVDFDWINHAHIPTAIVLPEPIWLCNIRLKYNARCRPERDWTPQSPGTPPSASGPPPNPYTPLERTTHPRRGRMIDANAALALARFFSYLHNSLGVVQVDHAGIWPGQANPDNPAPNSAHGHGKAIDLCFFYVVRQNMYDCAGFYGPPTNGIQAGHVCRDWGPLLQAPTTPKERFLRRLYGELRNHWHLVLGPDDTAAGVGQGDHTTHFHVDVHHYTNPA